MIDKVLLIEDLRQEARRLNFAADVLERKDTPVPSIAEFADSLRQQAGNENIPMPVLDKPIQLFRYAPLKPKGRMSEAGKEAIRQAQRKRWRKFHKQKGGRQSK